MTSFLYQLNISDGGVPKYPVREAWVSFLGVAGDYQRNRIVHGGKNRALCLYSAELIEALREEGHSIAPGSIGENLTLSGLEWSQMSVGSQLTIGKDLRIEITSHCEPCRHIAEWFNDGNYERISQKTHPGWSRLYARVLVEGIVRQGDAVQAQLLEGLKV